MVSVSRRHPQQLGTASGDDSRRRHRQDDQEDQGLVGDGCLCTFTPLQSRSMGRRVLWHSGGRQLGGSSIFSTSFWRVPCLNTSSPTLMWIHLSRIPSGWALWILSSQAATPSRGRRQSCPFAYRRSCLSVYLFAHVSI